MLRQVGESYKDYAARMYGWARAAEDDRDRKLAAAADQLNGLCDDREDLSQLLRGMARRVMRHRERAAVLQIELDMCREDVGQLRATKTVGGPPPACTPGWESGPSTRPATAPPEEAP